MKKRFPFVIVWALLGISMSLPPFTLGQATAAPADQPATQPQVTFQFERASMAVPRFTLLVREDGTGAYQADEAAVAATIYAARATPGKHIDRTLTLSPSTTATIFKAARSADHFNITCSSKAKNVADTGKKTLSYNGSDGQGSCTYNFSENKNVAMLTETFMAIAFTMDEGRKLEYLHRYDRLGLDAEMESLIHEYEAKRALEIGTIAPTLTSLVDDTALIQRVRMRAARLLAQTEAASGSPSAQRP